MIAAFLGVDSGLFWMVGGVWLVRRVWGRPPGLGWGVACFTAALRWGTFSLGDVQAATRATGPTLASGSRPVLIGAALAFAAALLEESASDALRSPSVVERAAAGAAVLVLVPAYCAPGAGEPNLPLSLVWWTVAGFVLTLVTLVAAPAARKVPGWAAPLIACAGALTVGWSL